ncbi:hypothetical protein SAMN02745823_00780 [Sporobacter termitidis DSM 10068]|uniref:Uncharacterized protein n=1 Tax=Sporobacter termitidis DSM 10068 TaxID=1123282 RepID=A0A1M5VEQ2_9FIRM|nr:hypothetical protein [Sporobacter termitidis]SHH73403.1 hypothetical protein SAMN02745823_00780 [Sporobacter termitidis DSM 10068]
MGSKVSTGNTQELKSAMTKWLKEFPGELICARQIWYEGLGGCGVPNPTDVEAMEAVLNGLGDWKNVGTQRYEKFGGQNSWKRVQ